VEFENMYDNVIVTDCDGCFLFWEHGFHMWMVSKGYKSTTNGFYRIEDKYGISVEEADNLVDAFNESAALRRLPPVKDAMKYIRKLHEEHGYVFHAITAIPNTRDMYEARLENIENLFGKTAFERVTLCGHSANKKELLKEYEDTGCFWIEDLTVNLKYGVDLGMNGILMDRHYNRKDNPTFPHKRVHNWKEIYETITGEG
jgi:FMN phosphatase YigB (HAD superfamily)